MPRPLLHVLFAHHPTCMPSLPDKPPPSPLPGHPVSPSRPFAHHASLPHSPSFACHFTCTVRTHTCTISTAIVLRDVNHSRVSAPKPESQPHRPVSTPLFSTRSTTLGSLPHPPNHDHTAQSVPLSYTILSAPHSKKPRGVHPSNWNVEDVIDWLRVKLFDDKVCNNLKFLEQVTTGDALLKLDVGVLKSEIGIVAYGNPRRLRAPRRPVASLSSRLSTLVIFTPLLA